MTTAPAVLPRRRGAASRVLPVARLLVANPWTTLVQPWLVLGVIFAANWLLWAIITATTSGDDRRDTLDGFQYSGAVFYVFVYMLVVGVQAMNASFPFAMGLGASRRDFYLGTLLTFGGLSAVYAVGLTVLASLEDATGGWGLGGRLFAPVYFGADAWWGERLWLYLVGLLCCFIVGSSLGAVFVRWGSNGLIAFFAGAAALVVGGVALLTLTGSWPRLGAVLADAGAGGIVSALVVPAALAAIVGYAVLRRAQVRA